MAEITVGVVDYEMGNVGSIMNMLRKLGVPAILTRDPDALADAGTLILPGVGSFDRGMSQLHELGLVELLGELVLHGRKAILGICLGMQLMTERSEEGRLPGLGWIDAEATRFNFHNDSNRKVPHMGWATTRAMHHAPVMAELEDSPRFYFVHSYYVTCRRPEDIVAVANYGHDFVAYFQRDNIHGAQFHPEKSHRFGLQLLKNYVSLAAGD